MFSSVNKRIKREMDEELQLHLDMLEAEYLRKGMTAGGARALSRKRFGDVEQIKNECLNIRRRTLRRMLTFLFSLLFAGGALLRAFTTDRAVLPLADLSMVVAVLAYAFMYARSVSPSHFVNTTGISIFNSNREPAVKIPGK